MAKIYLETELLLLAAAKKENEEKIFSDLEGHELFISDLVLAEIHNLDEQHRYWMGKFFEEKSFPVIRIDEASIEFARKYVYNRVITMDDYTVGLHYALCARKGIEVIATPNQRFVELLDGFRKINDHFRVPNPEIKIFELERIKSSLSYVRERISRLLETQGSLYLFKAIVESQDHFKREKKLSFKRVERA